MIFSRTEGDGEGEGICFGAFCLLLNLNGQLNTVKKQTTKSNQTKTTKKKQITKKQKTKKKRQTKQKQTKSIYSKACFRRQTKQMRRETHLPAHETIMQQSAEIEVVGRRQNVSFLSSFFSINFVVTIALLQQNKK